MSFIDGEEKTLEVKKDTNEIIYDEIKYPLPNFGKNSSSENVLKIYDCKIEITSGPDFLTIKIPFIHPDFGTRYGILVAAPIGYTS